MDKILLFLGLCCLVYAQDDRDGMCPNNIEQLLAMDQCTRACIGIGRDGCPLCRDGCTDVADQCRPDDPSSCSENQTCLARGGGFYECINRLEEGEVCDTGLDFQAVVPCRIGLLCRRETLERSVCVRIAELGPCPRARLTNDQVMCDEDGNFEPLQCTKNADSSTYLCGCVEPTTGVIVAGTAVEVRSRDDVPDCEDRVRDRCTYRSALGVIFEVRSGETFIDLSACRRCLCRDGDSVLCEALRDSDCGVINPTPGPDRDCTIRGRTLPSGESVAVDCNRCACKNGELYCTRRDCEEDEEDGDDEEDPQDTRDCRACGAMRAAPVCGDDGRTYPSRCFAVTCRGLDAEDLRPGPCFNRDVCSENPCEEGDICVRTRGVTCLSREGCRPERLRRCIDFETLICRRREGDDDDDGDDETPTNGETPTSDSEEPTSDSEEPTDEDDSESSDGDEDDSESSDGDDDDDAVCGRDGRSYSSVCTLIQNAPQIEVAYEGRCNQTECLGGKVCGTDGETYNNICELRSNSANARVDYRGECEDPDDPDEVIDNKCSRLRRSGRCAALTDCTAQARVRPGDGCCPVCGGAVTIGLDRDAVDAYVRSNPTLDTVEEFLRELVETGFIPEEVVRRCKIVANLLDSGDMHVVLENLVNTDTICAMAAERIANRINNPPMSDDTSTVTPNPQILQLATVAQTSPLVDESGNLPASGAVPIVSFSLAAILIPIMSLLI